MKNLVRQNATNLTFIATAVLAAGQALQVGAALFGIVSSDAAIGQSYVLVTRGEYTLPKTASQAWAIGDRIYWDNTNKRLTNVAGSNLQVGVATVATGAGAGETTGQIKLGVATA